MNTAKEITFLSGHRYRHGYLLLSLLLVIVAPPFMAGLSWGVGVLEAALFISIIAGVYASAVGRKTFISISGLSALAILARVSWLIWPNHTWLYLFLIGYVLFYSVILAVLIRSLFQPNQRVTADTLLSAVSVYLIFGLVWTILYAILESAEPGSFSFGTDAIVNSARFDRFIGFSFTTLTTLGYGNVAPQNPKADVLATMEAIVGQIYVAVVIARLVAIQITQAPPSDRNNSD